MIISITAKCSDLCAIKAGKIEHDGYVPGGLGIGGGDYIQFRFNTKTGQILNFPELSDEDVKTILSEEED